MTKELLQLLELEHLTGDQRELADTIGIDAYRKLLWTFAGQDIYIPTLDRLLIPIRDAAIKAEYKGYNTGSLARKYNLTERWIREIVAGERREIDGQITLFDEM